jgi:tetratricopeptide (TPR) repeat protein
MKAKVIRIISLVMLLALSALAADKDREYLFKQGVSEYASEDYDKAIDIFTGLVKTGNVSWELYYNLGNAYYRSGKLGSAIQYWEKAKLLAPSQSDVNHNLAIAEQQLVDKVVLPEMFPLFRWYAQFQKKLPLDLAVMTIGFLLFAMLLILGLMRGAHKKKNIRKRSSYITITVVFLSLIIVLTAITVDTAYQRKHEKYAIILDEEALVLSEPNDKATVLFILHEGSKVKVNKNIEDSWSNVSYFDDKVGWIKQSAIGKIEE